MTDAEIWHQFHQFQKTAEYRWGKRVYQLIRRQARRVSRYTVDNGADAALLAIPMLVPEDEVRQLLRGLYTDVGVRWGNIEFANIEDYAKSYRAPRRFKRFGFNAIWEAILNVFFEQYGGEKIVSITDTTRRWLIDKIISGREAGEGAEQIARSMVDDKDIPLKRARVISRTETVAAANYGGATAARETGLKMIKRWVNARDVRVRELHRDQKSGGVGGEEVDLEQPFSNGLMHPGDPRGEAKQVIQCRCIASHRPKRDAQGMPIAA